MKTVLVTGISGFVGQHCAAELLKKGYAVKGSLRSLAKTDEVLNGIKKEIDPKGNLEFCELDLLSDKGWDKAMQGCEYVLHVASPYIIAEPKNENVMIQPAVEGTLRALNAAKKAGVHKVVITSSIAAMVGDKKKNHLTQESWTNPNTDKISAYMKSKTLAEKAAWNFYNHQSLENKMELTVVNPGPIYGPTLTGNIEGASMKMMKDLIIGKMSMQPNCHFLMSDVRDIAKIHVAALEKIESNGQRFIVTTDKTYSFVGVATMLKENGYKKVKPRQASTLFLKFISVFNREVKGMLPFIDSEISANISTTKKIFNWTPIPFEKTLIDTAKSVEEVLYRNKN